MTQRAKKKMWLTATELTDAAGCDTARAFIMFFLQCPFMFPLSSANQLPVILYLVG